MNKEIKYIKEMCGECGYPDGAAEELEAACLKISQNPEAKDTLFAQIKGYEESIPDEFDYDHMIEVMESLEEPTGVSKYTLYYIAYVLLTPKMKEHYIERNIDLAIYKDSMYDLKWKLIECKRLHGVFGTHAPSWHKYFFKMELFTLGRLQFHTKKSGKTGTVCGIKIDEDTTVINTHIPSSGPLKVEDCIDSYTRAEKFFRNEFPEGGPVIFMCDSWLLFPEHKLMLPETSGIRRFAEQFTIIHARYSAPHQRPWPIFYEAKDLPADELPEKTALERVYKERYVKGLPSGSACGIIIFKDGKILNTEKDKML